MERHTAHVIQVTVGEQHGLHDHCALGAAASVKGEFEAREDQAGFLRPDRGKGMGTALGQESGQTPEGERV